MVLTLPRSDGYSPGVRVVRWIGQQMCLGGETGVRLACDHGLGQKPYLHRIHREGGKRHLRRLEGATTGRERQRATGRDFTTDILLKLVL